MYFSFPKNITTCKGKKRKDNLPKFVAFLNLKEISQLSFDILSQDMFICMGCKVLEGCKLVYLIPI